MGDEHFLCFNSNKIYGEDLATEIHRGLNVIQ